MRVTRDTPIRGGIRAPVIIHRTDMRVGAITVGPALITAVPVTTMGDRVIRIMAIIRGGRLRRMGITRIQTTGVIRIRTTGVIPAIILTTSRAT